MSSQRLIGDTPVEIALHIWAQHAEGPLWDAATGRLWWVDITGERVHCFDPDSTNDSSWSTEGQPGGVVLSASGEPVVACPDGLGVLDRATGMRERPQGFLGHRTIHRAGLTAAATSRGGGL